jgi:hypothetical protein
MYTHGFSDSTTFGTSIEPRNFNRSRRDHQGRLPEEHCARRPTHLGHTFDAHPSPRPVLGDDGNLRNSPRRTRCAQPTGRGRIPGQLREGPRFSSWTARAELVESSSNARPRDRRYSSSATARNGTPRCNAARAEQNHDRRPAFSELSSIDAALLCRFYGYLHKDMDINNDERDPFAPSANRPPSCEQS